MKKEELSKKEILKYISEHPGVSVKIAITDIDGILRGKQIRKDKFYLIEALGNSIAKDILNGHPVDSLLVRVRKPHAPVKGVLDTIEVEIERNKADYV